MGYYAGKYRWRTTGRTIDFDLERDWTFHADDKPDKVNIREGGGLVREGKGTWSVREGRLTITMTHVWAITFWKKYMHSFSISIRPSITGPLAK
jgi:hypothetical protein